VHETGHFLDLMGIGTKGQFSSASGEAGMDKVSEAIKASKAFKVLESGFNTAATRRERGYYGYLITPHELWARAYAQFVAQESRHPTLLADLANLRKMHVGRQWEADDFEPIAVA